MENISRNDVKQEVDAVRQSVVDAAFVKHEITDPAQREKLLALAALPTLQYEAKREPVAKELGVRKGALDTVVEQLRIALAIDSGEGIDACDAKAGALDMLLAIGDEVELFRAAGEDDPERGVYALVRQSDHVEVRRVTSGWFKAWLRQELYARHGKGVSSEALQTAIGTLIGKGMSAPRA